MVAGESPDAGNDFSVHRLTTGALVWYSETDACGNGIAVAFVVAQRVISGGGCGTPLTARNLATGAVIWSRSGTWQLWRGDTDADTGRHIYATNAGGSVVSLSPLDRKDSVLAGRCRQRARRGRRPGVCDLRRLRRVRLRHHFGSRQWNTQLGSAPQLAAAAGGVLYLDSGLALNTGTGKTMATLCEARQPGRRARGWRWADCRCLRRPGPRPLRTTRILNSC